MVVVVPAFAHREEADEEIVPALVGRDEFASAVGVADGIDGPGDMVVEKHPDQSAPKEAVEAPLSPPKA